MRGLTIRGGRLELRRDLPRPDPGDGEVLLKMLAAGICSTDHHLAAGMYDFEGILGHEFVAEVVAGPDSWQGQRVVGEINLACTRCEVCRAGREKHCPERTVLGIVGKDGAFADFFTLPLRNLHRVPQGLENQVAVLAEPLAAALEIQERIDVTENDRVLVVGDGKLGQCIAQTLARTGCELSVIGRHGRKLAPLAAIGAATAIGLSPKPASFDVAVECTGNSTGYELARAAVRPQGTLVLKSTYSGRLSVDATMLAVDEIRVVGSRCGPFPEALRLLESGNLALDYLFDATYPLDEAMEAFRHSARSDVLKVGLLGGE